MPVRYSNTYDAIFCRILTTVRRACDLPGTPRTTHRQVPTTDDQGVLLGRGGDQAGPASTIVPSWISLQSKETVKTKRLSCAIRKVLTFTVVYQANVRVSQRILFRAKFAERLGSDRDDRVRRQIGLESGLVSGRRRLFEEACCRLAWVFQGYEDVVRLDV